MPATSGTRCGKRKYCVLDARLSLLVASLYLLFAAKMPLGERERDLVRGLVPADVCVVADLVLSPQAQPSPSVVAAHRAVRRLFSARAVGERYGVSHQTVIDKARRLRELLPLARDLCDAQQHGERALVAGRRGRRKGDGRKVTTAWVARLKELALSPQTSCLTLGVYRSVLASEFPDVAVSKSTIARVLRKDLNITMKRVTVIAAGAMRPANVAYRRVFAREWFRDVDAGAIGDVTREADAMRAWTPRVDPRLLFFGDESGFNLVTGNPQWARAVRGQRARISRTNARGQHHSLVLISGFVDGIVATHWKGGSYKGQDFADFLSSTFVPYITSYREHLPMHLRRQPVRLVLDNCRIHKTKEVRDVLRDARINLVFLPPYTPVLNPCENIFSHIKGAMRREHWLDRIELSGKRKSALLEGRVYGHLHGVQARLVRRFYRRCAWGRRAAGDE